MRVPQQWCEDHRTNFLGACPFCEGGLEPVRFQNARTDFGGLPLAGTVDILPHYRTVTYSDVVSTLGQQLADLERMQQAAMAPFHARKTEIFRQMRKMHLDPASFSRAVRVHIGLAQGSGYLKDPVVQQCLAALRAQSLK